MSVITLRFGNDSRGKWSHQSDRTFHLEDWDIGFHGDEIVAHPLPMNLIWRIFTAVFFIGLAIGLLFVLTPRLIFAPSESTASNAPETVPSDQTAALLERIGVTPPPAEDTARSPGRRSIDGPPHLRRPRPSLEEIDALNEKLLNSLSDERRQRVEQKLRQNRQRRAAERRREAERMERHDRIIRVIGWCFAPLVIFIGLLSAWIGWRWGLLAVLRYPFDRISIVRTETPAGTRPVLRVTRGKIRGQSEWELPIDSLECLQLSLRRIGNSSMNAYSRRTYHWVVGVNPKRIAGLSPLEFYVYCQPQQPGSVRETPARVDWFLEHLREMTGCPLVMMD